MKKQDSDIIAGITGSLKAREEVFRYLYLHSGIREQVVRHVCQTGGDVLQGEDVFQECMILLDRNIREARFEGRSLIHTYAIGIARQVWFNMRRTLKKVSYSEISNEIPEEMTLSNEDVLLQKERVEWLNQIMKQLDVRCIEILKLYKLSFSNQEIANQLGIYNATLAKKYTYRCREKLKALIRNIPGAERYFTQ